MKKYLAVAATFCLSGGVLGATVPASHASGQDGTASLKAEGTQFLNAHRDAVSGSAADKYDLQRTTVSPSGTVHQRYDRTYHGLQVLGGDFVVHTAKNARPSVSVTQDKPISVSTEPAVSASQALKAVKGKSSKPTLVVDARQGAAKLAWMTMATGVQADGITPSRRATLVDAQTGKVRSSVETIKTLMSAKDSKEAMSRQGVAASAKKKHTLEAGTGNGIFVGEVPIGTTAGGSGFDMIDPDHGNNTTCDMNNSESGPCTTFTDADNTWGDGTNADRASAAVDVHYGAGLTFDFYKSTFDRNGIFDDGQGVPSRVHYGDGYVNAFWDGSQMTYGDGAGNNAPLVALDVAGHEMSHGVTEATAGLEYTGDAGGLNESTSDVMGTMVEFSANNANDPGDYLIGEEIDINGDGSPLRYMDEPSKDGGSYDCWSSAVPQSDPHYSSGVGNHAFYLMANGSGSSEWGDSPTCDGSTVTGIGRDKAAAVWYHALKDYMTSSETYADARADMISAADDLYGAGSAESKGVAAAFSAVAVG